MYWGGAGSERGSCHHKLLGWSDANLLTILPMCWSQTNSETFAKLPVCRMWSASAESPAAGMHAGVALVAHLLQQRSPRHLTLDLLHAMEALLRAVGPSEVLHTAVMQRLLLNLRLWAAAPLPIQRSFQALLLKLAKVAPLRPALSHWKRSCQRACRACRGLYVASTSACSASGQRMEICMLLS